MKNIINIKKTFVKCYDCEEYGFFSITDINTTCPFCGKCDNDDYDNNDHLNIDFHFCDNCGILFKIGCTHAVNGCATNIYNAHVINLWTYYDTIFEGMPQFDNVTELCNKWNNIKILELKCLNSGKHCIRCHYPKNEYPEYYDNCELCVKYNDIKT